LANSREDTYSKQTHTFVYIEYKKKKTRRFFNDENYKYITKQRSFEMRIFLLRVFDQKSGDSIE